MDEVVLLVKSQFLLETVQFWNAQIFLEFLIVLNDGLIPLVFGVFILWSFVGIKIDLFLPMEINEAQTNFCISELFGIFADFLDDYFHTDRLVSIEEIMGIVAPVGIDGLGLLSQKGKTVLVLILPSVIDLVLEGILERLKDDLGVCEDFNVERDVCWVSLRETKVADKSEVLALFRLVEIKSHLTPNFPLDLSVGLFWLNL